jgi:hypothetical protein
MSTSQVLMLIYYVVNVGSFLWCVSLIQHELRGWAPLWVLAGALFFEGVPALALWSAGFWS